MGLCQAQAQLKSLAKRLNEKLSPRYCGPYQVEAWVGQVAYKLDLPDSTFTHPMFHVSIVMVSCGRNLAGPTFSFLADRGLGMEGRTRVVEGLHYNSKPVLKALIKWRNLPAF